MRQILGPRGRRRRRGGGGGGGCGCGCRLKVAGCISGCNLQPALYLLELQNWGYSLCLGFLGYLLKVCNCSVFARLIGALDTRTAMYYVVSVVA